MLSDHFEFLFLCPSLKSTVVLLVFFYHISCFTAESSSLSSPNPLCPLLTLSLFLGPRKPSLSQLSAKVPGNYSLSHWTLWIPLSPFPPECWEYIFVFLGTEQSEVLRNRITVQVNDSAITTQQHMNLPISRLDKTANSTTPTERSASVTASKHCDKKMSMNNKFPPARCLVGS